MFIFTLHEYSKFDSKSFNIWKKLLTIWLREDHKKF